VFAVTSRLLLHLLLPLVSLLLSLLHPATWEGALDQP
jgi:hypothetical protein